MTAFNPLQVLSILTPRMIVCGLIYSLRSAMRVVQSTQPHLHGIAFWRAVRAVMRQPAIPEMPPFASFQLPGRVVGIETDQQKHVMITTEHGALRIAPLAADLVQIRFRPDGVFPEPFSYGVEKPEGAWQPVRATVSQSESHLAITTGAMAVGISKNPCRLTIRNADGQKLLADQDVGYHPDDQQIIWRAAYDPGTAFYGLGEKANTLNHAGRRFELWNSDPAAYERGKDPLYMGIPFVIALSNGCAVGLFFDNSFRTWIDCGATTAGMMEYRALGGEFRLYVMVGTPQTVLERYTELTGRMKLPPLWALGLHQSRWSYYPQKRVLEIAQEFRRRRLPCDVIHLDIHYMDDYRCFTWHPKRFPDPRRMLNVLHGLGFKALSMIDPGIQICPGYHVYDEGLTQNRFICYPDGKPFAGPVWPGNCHFPDFSSPAVREWWGGLYDGLLADGVDAFWNDMNEIALIAPGASRPWVPDIVQHDKDGQGASHAEIHNVYGLLMARASAEGLRRLRPDRRPLILTRSGWAGVQRYAIHWTGDNRSTWDHLRLSVQMALNLGLSGVAMTGPDTGGFTGGPSPELFVRWMQVSTFMPFFRIHSMIGSPPQEPWAFGPEVEAISRRYLELRYRLLPYIYTAVWQASRTGIPIMRPLSFVYPDDPATYSMDDQYLFGDALLVAPIFEAGATQRAVYLPSGTWYDFWTGGRYRGGQTVSVDAPLDTLPLFIQGGAMIPFWPVQQYVGEKTVDELEIYACWAVGDYDSLLYEDDGTYPDYELPTAHRLTRFHLTGYPGRNGGVLRRITEHGEFVPSYTHIRLHVIGLDAPPADVYLSGGGSLFYSWEEDSGRLILEADIPGDFELRLD